MRRIHRLPAITDPLQSESRLCIVARAAEVATLGRLDGGKAAKAVHRLKALAA